MVCSKNFCMQLDSTSLLNLSGVDSNSGNTFSILFAINSPNWVFSFSLLSSISCWIDSTALLIFSLCILHFLSSSELSSESSSDSLSELSSESFSDSSSELSSESFSDSSSELSSESFSGSFSASFSGSFSGSFSASFSGSFSGSFSASFSGSLSG